MNRLLRKLLATYCGEADDGASGAAGSAVEGTGNADRLALYNRIASQADAERADQFMDINDDDTLTPFMVQTAEGDQSTIDAQSAAARDKAEADRVAAEVAADNARTQQVQPQLYTIKVNGVERQVTLEELTARAQKVESADQYLAEAARMRSEALAAQKVGPSQDALLQQQADEDLALARAIQMGDEAEAVAAIRKLRAVPPRQDDLPKLIDERLTFNEAISAFRTEFSDIVGDPYLNKLALDNDARLIESGDNRPYIERYREIGTNLRNWVASKNPAPAAAPAVVDKLTRKANAPTTPTAANAKVAGAPAEEKEETVQETIAAIAKARGGPQWLFASNG